MKWWSSYIFIARKLYGLEDSLIFQVQNGIWEPQIESQAETVTHGLSLNWEKLIYSEVMIVTFVTTKSI